MDRSDCWGVTASRGVAPGVPDPVLAAAWREFAELAGAACVLRVRSGVPTLAWVNRALCELLAVDAGQLAGHALRDLVEPEPVEPEPVEPEPVEPEPVEPGLPPSGLAPSEVTVPLPRLAGEPDPLTCWAVTVHRLARGSGGSALARLVRPDGSHARVHVRVVPIGRPQTPSPGAVTVPDPGIVGALPAPAGASCWLVTMEEVREALEEVESALTVAEHRFTALAGCAPVGIFASHAGLRLGFVNERFVALTGMQAHALLGTGWLDAVHRDDLPAIYSAAQTVLGGASVELTVRLTRDDDQQCWLQLRLAPTTTPARAAGFIGTAEDVTQRRSWEEHLTYQVRHDPLTGLVNRRRLIEVLTDLLSGRRARDREFAVLFLDLDGFKEVNDTHGHDVGDRVLVEVARRMQRVVRETDVLARVAGDEFVVVLRHITCEAEAAAAARRHLAALGPPVRIGRTDVLLTASIGVALPSGFDTPESLLRTADRVMYEAKAAGHGLYRLASVTGDGQ